MALDTGEGLNGVRNSILECEWRNETQSDHDAAEPADREVGDNPFRLVNVGVSIAGGDAPLDEITEAGVVMLLQQERAAQLNGAIGSYWATFAINRYARADLAETKRQPISQATCSCRVAGGRAGSRGHRLDLRQLLAERTGGHLQVVVVL
jgi:hypothetical protein